MTRLVCAALVALAGCGGKDEDSTPVPTGGGTTTPPPSISQVQIGNPFWQIGELVLFTGPAGDGTQACLLNGPHVWDGAVWSPGTPHEPPYQSELSAGLAGCALTEADTFEAAQMQAPNGIWLGLVIVPKAGNAPGSSPDFPLGDVIYDDRYPFVIDADVRRDDLIVDADNDFIFPGAATWGHVVTGLSHMPLLFTTNHERMPAGASPNGAYEWRVQIRDATSVVEDSGWDLVVPYTVLPPAE